jgi:hypothetical protein
MLFSHRKGLKQIKCEIQTRSMDQDLRNGLWDAIYLLIVKHESYSSDAFKDMLFSRLWHSYYKDPLDTIKTPWIRIRKTVLEGDWNEVYDMVEFIANNYPDETRCDDFVDFCNQVLARELSGYRFVDKQIVEITTEEEIEEIEQAANTGVSKLAPVESHIKTAIKHLSDKKEPNYRDSIKESISAVEAMCSIIDGKKATLSTALKKIKDKIGLHPALEDAFTKLYGYAGDADGIRHALLEESNLDFEDAKFMLVACSGFINYLVVKGQKAGIF